MSFRVEFTKSAAKALRSIPKRDQRRIAKKIEGLAAAPADPAVTKLRGDNPFYRVRVGDYRIIYEIREPVLLILVLKIEHRKDVYRGLS